MNNPELFEIIKVLPYWNFPHLTYFGMLQIEL